MRKLFKPGFTIIEVMLFLGIGGVLTAGIILTIGSGISAQRYRQAVSILKSDIQQQFERSTTVVNIRQGNIDECVGEVGRSNCVILGSYLTMSGDGRVARYDVYGVNPDEESSGDSELPKDEYSILTSYQPRVNESSKQEWNMEWGVNINREGGSHDVMDIGMMTVRSPETGITYLFNRNSLDTNNLGTIINKDSRARQVICVNPAGFSINERLAVVIGKNAGSSTAVEVLSNSMLSEEGLRC